MPVLSLGIVEPKFESLFLAGVSEFLHDVAAKRSLVDNVVFVVPGTKHGKAVVMFGGDDDVFHAGSFSSPDKLFSVEFDRVELLGVLFVLGDRNFAAAHHPLGAVGELLAFVESAGRGVDSPVHKHAEPCLFPPSHSRFAVNFGFFVF